MDTSASERPFSLGWTVLSIGVFLAIELLIGTYVGPVVLGKYVSPMFHMQLQMMMHLASFYAGGVLVGILSPGVRIKEPAVGAFLSVAVVFMMSFFMPMWFYGFTLSKLLIGGGIAFGLALTGAYSGEKLMGNIRPDDDEADRSARGRLRASLWNNENGLFVARDRSRRP